MVGSDKIKCGPDQRWLRASRISAGFVLGTACVWYWQAPSDVSAGILAVAIGTALGVIAFGLTGLK